MHHLRNFIHSIKTKIEFIFFRIRCILSDLINDRRNAARVAAIAFFGLLFVINYGRIAHVLLFSPAGPRTLNIFGINFAGNYSYLNAQYSRPIFVDHSGKVIGMYPGPFPEDKYIAVRIREVPDLWWKMVQLLEDGNHGKWYYVQGVDLSQIIKVPVRFFLQGKITGGSTIPMQLVKTMQADTDKRMVPLLFRKIRDYLHAPAMYYHLEILHPGMMKTWYATHVPLLYNSNEHGLVAASFLLFHKMPEDLSLAEQALLAAAVKWRLGIRSKAGWKRAKARARHALGLLFSRGAIGPEALKKAERELSALGPYRNMNFYTNGNACLKNRKRLQQIIASKSMASRAVFTAHGEAIEAGAELRDILGPDWWKKVSRVRLTINMDANCRFKWSIFNRKRILFSRIARIQEQRRVPQDQTLIAKARKGTTYTVVSLTTENGEIVRYYSDPYLPYYHGYTPGTQRYDPFKETRKIGSIGKIIVAFIAAEEGDTPQTMYFMARRKKTVRSADSVRQEYFHNFDGQIGYLERSDPRGRVSALEAFAQSNNLAIIDRLEHSRSKKRFSSLVELLGFSLYTRPPLKISERDLVVDIPMGNINGSARTIQALVQAVASNLLNNASSGLNPCPPHIVSKYTFKGKTLDYCQQVENPMVNNMFKTVKKMLQKKSSRFFLKKVLGAVVDPRAHGTASKTLGRWHPSLNPLVKWHIAKTGTTSSGEESLTRRPGTLNAMITGAIHLKGKTYTYVAQIGPRGREPDIGPWVYGGQTGALVDTALSNLVEGCSNKDSGRVN